MPGAARTAIIAALSVLAVSCGGAGANGQTGSAALRIDSAEWRAGPEPRVVVSGEWGMGISTPPTCDLLEGESGEESDRYDQGSSVELDGGRFRKEFVGVSGSEGPPDTEYRVRCRVSMSTGKSVEASAPVEGEIPAPRPRGGASAILGRKVI